MRSQYFGESVQPELDCGTVLYCIEIERIKMPPMCVPRTTSTGRASKHLCQRKEKAPRMLLGTNAVNTGRGTNTLSFAGLWIGKLSASIETTLR